MRDKKKRDIEAESTNRREEGYQITSFCIRRCGFRPLKKINSLIAPKAIENMTIVGNTPKVVAYLKPVERLVTAERTMFLSTAQGSDETEIDFLARRRKAARYFKLEILETSSNIQAELIRVRQVLAVLKNEEKKLKNLHAIRLNENVIDEDLLQTLQ